MNEETELALIYHVNAEVNETWDTQDQSHLEKYGQTGLSINILLKELTNVVIMR